MHQRVFMNQVGSGSGNGASPTPSPTPAIPPAPGPVATPAPVVTTPAQGPAPVVDAKAIAETVRDSIFAELRRTGVLGKESKSKEPPSPAAAPDLSRLRQLDRALTRAGRAPNEEAYGRIERAFVEEAPSDPDTWLRGFYEGMGIAQPQTGTPPVAPASPPQRSTTPVSDGGSPPVPRVPLEEANIFTMSPEDRNHLIKQKGAAWYRARIVEQGRGVSIKLK